MQDHTPPLLQSFNDVSSKWFDLLTNPIYHTISFTILLLFTIIIYHTMMYKTLSCLSPILLHQQRWARSPTLWIFKIRSTKKVNFKIKIRSPKKSDLENQDQITKKKKLSSRLRSDHKKKNSRSRSDHDVEDHFHEDWNKNIRISNKNHVSWHSIQLSKPPLPNQSRCLF